MCPTMLSFLHSVQQSLATYNTLSITFLTVEIFTEALARRKLKFVNPSGRQFVPEKGSEVPFLVRLIQEQSSCKAALEEQPKSAQVKYSSTLLHEVRANIKNLESLPVNENNRDL